MGILIINDHGDGKSFPFIKHGLRLFLAQSDGIIDSDAVAVDIVPISCRFRGSPAISMILERNDVG
jgi:hypothetical protein